MPHSVGVPEALEENTLQHSTEPHTLLLHHIGCAVPNMDAALEIYCKGLGLRQVTGPIEVRSQGVRVCFVEAGPSVYIELVEGIGVESPVSRLVSQTGGGPYHLCFQVKDLDVAVPSLRNRGFVRLKRFELEAHGMKRFAFMLAPDRQIVEFCDTGGNRE